MACTCTCTSPCNCVCMPVYVCYRAELLMRQKVGYLESVNAELCEQLERCDAEAFSHQGGLQAEKAELAARMRQLQEEVSTLCLCVLSCVAYFCMALAQQHRAPAAHAFDTAGVFGDWVTSNQRNADDDLGVLCCAGVLRAWLCRWCGCRSAAATT